VPWLSALFVVRKLKLGYLGSMSEPAKKLLVQAMQLSTDDRAALAAELLASLDGDPEAHVEAAWAAEIESRVKRVTAGDGKFEDWGEIREQLRPKE